MKRIFFLINVAAFCSCSSQKVVNTKRIEMDSLKTVIENSQDSMVMKEPACIRDLVKKFKAEEKQNPARSVFRYTYKERKVYYVPAICCDFFSDLYDDQCNLIAHPDGGFTGRGDGKAEDFKDKRTDGILIWKDERK
ncbi:MAG: hypothetical protein ABI741_00975 [Ferruginibacter sp.]